MLAHAGQIDAPVDRPQHMVGRHMPLQAEAEEQRLLQHRPLTHHACVSRRRPSESAPSHGFNQPFSTKSAQSGRLKRKPLNDWERADADARYAPTGGSLF
jgi:hypothetical protein